jgi:DNA-binding MarR family transcriptional regulator
VEQTTGTHDRVALDELKEYDQWVAWDYRGKRKIPIDPHTRLAADTTNPDTWGSYEEALAAAGSSGRVGFVFSGFDPFTGIDLDDCVDGDGVAPWALEIVKLLDSYTEVSPSGTGLKVWVRASKPSNDRCRVQVEDGQLEVYDRDRFFTFTGWQFEGYAIAERQEQLERLYYRLFPATEHQGINTVVGGRGFNGEDTELLDKARNATTGKRFIALYDHGDTSKYSGDASRADLALCGFLAYWTACDAERMDRLFQGSKLMRTKWNERRGNSTYGEQTIAVAIKNCANVYDPGTYKAAVQDDIRLRLAGCIELALSGKWSGRSGPTDRDVYKALINTGLEYGKLVDGGVEVSASLRDLALGSGIGRRATVSDGLKRLESRGFIRRVYNGGTRKASKYIILSAQDRTIINRVNKYGTPLRATQRVRNPGQTYGTIGKRNGQILDFVHSLNRVVKLEEIAALLGARERDLKKRNIPLLLELELLKEADGGYVVPTNLENRLERELEESGCNKAESVQRRNYEIERAAWREKDSATTTVLILDEHRPDDERGYIDEEDLCIHGIKESCYLHNPNHPYRLKEKELVA